jgi:hypothetical protein
MDSDTEEVVDITQEEEEKKEKKKAVVRLEALQKTLEIYSKNRGEDLTVYSDVPHLCKTSVCYVGIDEAGRGPVLG